MGCIIKVDTKNSTELRVLREVAEVTGAVISGDEEMFFRPFRRDVENPWESESGYVDTRVDRQGNFIDPQVREYVKRHRLTYPESATIGSRPPFGRY